MHKKFYGFKYSCFVGKDSNGINFMPFPFPLTWIKMAILQHYNSLILAIKELKDKTDYVL